MDLSQRGSSVWGHTSSGIVSSQPRVAAEPMEMLAAPAVPLPDSVLEGSPHLFILFNGAG